MRNLFKSTMLAAVAAGGIAAATPAAADFTVCNRSNTRVDVALGYNNPQQGWISVGWYVVEPGDCNRALTGSVADDAVYVYAMGNDGRFWQAQRNQQGGWFCVQNRRFTVRLDDVQRNNVINCDGNGRSRQFIRVNTNGNDNFRFNLDD